MNHEESANMLGNMRSDEYTTKQGQLAGQELGEGSITAAKGTQRAAAAASAA